MKEAANWRGIKTVPALARGACRRGDYGSSQHESIRWQSHWAQTYPDFLSRASFATSSRMRSKTRNILALFASYLGNPGLYKNVFEWRNSI